MHRTRIALLLAALLPLAAQAGTRPDAGRDLDQARQEVRRDMAHERARLDSDNLSLDGLRFGRSDERSDAQRPALPKGEITPSGDLLVDGKPVAIDTDQRRQLLDYRAQVLALARLGIDAGERAALQAIDATDVSLFRLIVGGMSGSLERRVDASVRRELQPTVLQICRRLPPLRIAQQALAASVPAFRPYATLRDDNAADCERDVRSELAAR